MLDLTKTKPSSNIWSDIRFRNVDTDELVSIESEHYDLLNAYLQFFSEDQPLIHWEGELFLVVGGWPQSCINTDGYNLE